MDAGINGYDSLENGALELLTATEPDEVLRWAWFVADQGERSCLAIVGTDAAGNSTSVLLTAADVFASCRLAIESAEGFDPITAVMDQKPARTAETEALASAASVLSQTCTRQATNTSTPSDGLALWAVAGMAYAAAIALTKAGSGADHLR
jgi:hypothetical protein